MYECCLCETLIWHKCLSLPQPCMMMRMIAVCLSLLLYLSLSQPHATLGSSESAQPPYLWLSSRPRTSASPRRPVTANSQVRCLAVRTLSQRHLSCFIACCCGDRSKQVVAVLLFPKAKISVIWSKSRQYLLPSFSRHYCTWKARLIVVWCVSVREFGRSESSFMTISHYFWDTLYCDRWRQSKEEDFEDATFEYLNFSLWVPDPLG